MSRIAEVTRKTRETDITLKLDLDGSGKYEVKTGIPFMDHMMSAFARHGFFDITISADGDLEIDSHHTLEDLGLVLGEVIRKAVGDKAGIKRFGHSYVPMDEALVRVVLDLSGRPCLHFNVDQPTVEVGGDNVRLYREFFQAVVNTGGITLHIDMIHGEEVHHIYEAIFKAFGKALDIAVSMEDRLQGAINSTKGSL